MANNQKIELISFKTCPFVQRSVILLNEKKVDYEITYIDLANKPDWFLKISPFGKVPVLKVDGEVLFESAVISEYLDEVNPPSIHPADPLQKAKNRAWIEFASALIMGLFGVSIANAENQQEKLEGLRKLLGQLEEQLGDGPWFNGEKLALIDTAFAPFFSRFVIVEELYGQPILEGIPKIRKWGEKLLALESVKNSLVPEFKDLFIEFLQKRGSALVQI